MTNQIFVNQKLEFVEEIILHTDAHVFLTGKAGTGKTTFLRSLPMKTAKRMVVVAPSTTSMEELSSIFRENSTSLSMASLVPSARVTLPRWR